jgi:hypothetical protein
MLEQWSLIGKMVFLRPFGKEDLCYVQKWSNDPESRRLTDEVAPVSRAEAEEFYRQLCADKDRART